MYLWGAERFGRKPPNRLGKPTLSVLSPGACKHVSPHLSSPGSYFLGYLVSQLIVDTVL